MRVSDQDQYLRDLILILVFLGQDLDQDQNQRELGVLPIERVFREDTDECPPGRQCLFFRTFLGREDTVAKSGDIPNPIKGVPCPPVPKTVSSRLQNNLFI